MLNYTCVVARVKFTFTKGSNNSKVHLHDDQKWQKESTFINKKNESKLFRSTLINMNSNSPIMTYMDPGAYFS